MAPQKRDEDVLRSSARAGNADISRRKVDLVSRSALSGICRRSAARIVTVVGIFISER